MVGIERADGSVIVTDVVAVHPLLASVDVQV